MSVSYCVGRAVSELSLLVFQPSTSAKNKHDGNTKQEIGCEVGIGTQHPA